MLLFAWLVVGCWAVLPSLQPTDIETAVDSRIVVVFASKWCFKSMLAVEFVEKIAGKHTGVKFRQNDDRILAAQYNVRSYPTIVMFKSGEHWHYQFDLNQKELNYWLGVYLFSEFPMAPELDNLLQGSKHPYVLVAPRLNTTTGLLRNIALAHPAIQVMVNSTAGSTLCQFISQHTRTMLQKSGSTEDELSDCIAIATEHLHLYATSFDHRLRMQMIQYPFIGVILFHNESTDKPVAERYKDFTLALNAKLNGNRKVKMDYDVLSHHKQNRYVFLEGNYNRKMNRLLMEFINLSPADMPVIAAFSFTNNSLKSNMFKIDSYHTFSNSFLHWLSTQKHEADGVSTEKLTYCPQEKVIHRMRFNSLEDVLLNVQLVGLCKRLKLTLETDKRRWHGTPGVFYCQHTSLQRIAGDPLTWLARLSTDQQPQEL